MHSFFYLLFRSLFYIGLRSFWNLQFDGLENVPKRGGAILVANHVSFFDPPVLGGPIKRHTSFVARATLSNSKVFALFFYLVEGISIRRGEADSGALREVLRRLQAGRLVALFPEGTRSPDGKLGKFSDGVIVLARKAKVPVIPAGIAGTYEAFPRKGGMKRHPIRVIYGKPFDASVGTREEANEELRRRIGLLLEEARAKEQPL